MAVLSSADVPTPPPPPPPLVPPDLARMASVLSTIAVQARRTNIDRADDLRSALQLATSGELDAEGWSAAERAAHQLAGSAGTFGYAAASDLARELETLLVGFAQEGAPPPDAEELGEAFGLLDRLALQLAEEPDLD